MFPQISLARTVAEKNYLAAISNSTKTVTLQGFSRVHASHTDKFRLDFGYDTCRVLDRGTTRTDFSRTLIESGLPINEKMYVITMQSFATSFLCPEYKLKP